MRGTCLIVRLSSFKLLCARVEHKELWLQLELQLQSNQIEAIQKRAIHIIYPCAHDMPYTSAIFLAGLPTVPSKFPRILNQSFFSHALSHYQRLFSSVFIVLCVCVCLRVCFLVSIHRRGGRFLKQEAPRLVRRQQRCNTRHPPKETFSSRCSYQQSVFNSVYFSGFLFWGSVLEKLGVQDFS